MIIIINIGRIKCNRCGRGNNNFINLNNCFNFNNFSSTESIFKGDINISPIFCKQKNISISPNPQNKLFLKEKGEKKNKNLNKYKKQFIERPGDWICGKCKNLNFSFREKCNRCNLSKIANQKYSSKIEQ